MLTATLARTRRVCRGDSNDAGVTLTELVVTMSLMTVVGALALTTLLGTGDSSTRTTESGLTTAAARTAVSSWTSLLQVAVIGDPSTPATRNLTLTPTSISFNAQLDALPTCTDTCVTGGATAVTLAERTATDDGQAVVQLVETLQRGTNVSTRVLVPTGVIPPATGGCLFRPYANNGTVLPCTQTAVTSVAVARIDIAFAVTPAAGPTQSFTSSAKLPGAAS